MLAEDVSQGQAANQHCIWQHRAVWAPIVPEASSPTCQGHIPVRLLDGCTCSDLTCSRNHALRRCLLLGLPVDSAMLAGAASAAKMVLGDSSLSSTSRGLQSLDELLVLLFCSIPRLSDAELHAGLRDIICWQSKGTCDELMVSKTADQLR